MVTKFKLAKILKNGLNLSNRFLYVLKSLNVLFTPVIISLYSSSEKLNLFFTYSTKSLSVLIGVLYMFNASFRSKTPALTSAANCQFLLSMLNF